MYRLINANAAAVVQALRRSGDLREYMRLRADLVSNVAVTTSSSFQKAYRQYWRMNAARLARPFYERYFRLLAECQNQGRADIEQVTRLISNVDGIDHGLQFSFATKLAHMVDPRVPVFDSFVAGFYFFTPPSSDRPFALRLTALLGFHQFLQGEYVRILDEGLLSPAIARLRSDDHLDHSVPDERIVDWLLWAWVSLLRQGAQFRGEALYD